MKILTATLLSLSIAIAAFSSCGSSESNSSEKKTTEAASTTTAETTTTETTEAETTTTEATTTTAETTTTTAVETTTTTETTKIFDLFDDEPTEIVLSTSSIMKEYTQWLINILDDLGAQTTLTDEELVISATMSQRQDAAKQFRLLLMEESKESDNDKTSVTSFDISEDYKEFVVNVISEESFSEGSDALALLFYPKFVTDLQLLNGDISDENDAVFTIKIKDDMGMIIQTIEYPEDYSSMMG